MGRQVPAVERAVEVLELLADRPGESLTPSDIARSVAMSKASGHAIVTLLSERGYLLRHADKTYSLGPSILPLANTFLAEHDALPNARLQMSGLSRELGLDCVASAVVDDEIVLLARTNSSASFGVNARIGSRFPLVPPIGTVFLAWADAKRVDHWLAHAATTRAERARYVQALARVRERGYAVALGPRRVNGMPKSLDDYVLVDIRGAQAYPIGHIAAPVLDPQGTVQLAVTVLGFPEQLPAEQVPRLGRRLVDAATAVAQATWGLRP